MNILRTIAYALVITGAIVWGLVGFFNYNIVSAMFGDATVLSRIIYSLVGISGVIMLATAEREECYCENTDTTFR
jgi:uncharacterized membrane protein YuzA (DUF378 family)